MFEEKDIKNDLGIKPMNLFIMVLGLISSIITIGFSFAYFKLLMVIICILIVLIIILIAFIIVFLKRLYDMKKEYNDSVKNYNSLLESYNILDEKYNVLDEKYNVLNEDYNVLNEEYDVLDEKYNVLDEEYNVLDGKYKFSEENRESLLMMVEDKTKEVDVLNIELVRLDGFVYLLLQLHIIPDKYKLDEKHLRRIVYPEKEKERNDNDETI